MKSIIKFQKVLMKKTPFSVTILTLIVLFFMLLNGVKSYATILDWKILILYNSHPGPFYMITTNTVWFLISLMLLICIFQKYYRTPQFIYIAAGLYTTWFWIDRIIFQHRMNTLLFPMIGTCLVLMFIISILKHQDLIYYFERAGRL